MKLLNEYYLESFEKYAKAALGHILLIIRISGYAQMLNLKANEILQRAYLNETVDASMLQRDLFETGRDYVKKFSLKQKEIKNSKQKIILQA